MKSFVVILALVAVAAADVSHVIRGPDADAVVVNENTEVEADKYTYTFQTSNGIAAQESGVLKNPGREDEAISVQGSNSHTAPDGNVYQIKYVADENGYQPQGDHLPTPPPSQPIPDYILKSIQYNLEHNQESITAGRRF